MLTGSVPTLSVGIDAATNHMIGHAYDANGNMLSSPMGQALAYDAENRLTSTRRGQTRVAFTSHINHRPACADTRYKVAIGRPRMPNNKPLRLISTAALALLSVLSSCLAFFAAPGKALILDLDSFDPLTAYTVNGGELTERLPAAESFCTIALGHIRDVTGEYMLHDEGLHRFVNPDLQTVKTAVRDLSGRAGATFPLIPQMNNKRQVNDVRLAPDGNGVVFSGCSAQEIGGCQCGLALARSGKADFERLWCAPGEYHSNDQASWSPDSKQVVFSFAGSVWLLDVASRQTTYLAHGGAPRWSPAGDRIALTNGDEILIIDPRTKRSETHHIGVQGIIPTGLEWSPDAAFLTIVHRTANQPHDSRVRTALGIVDTATWQHRDLGIRLWGDKPSLRWVNLPPRNFTRLAQILVDACKEEPNK